MSLGYIYDEETGLYYCQSRYYDPETGRFLNADAFASTGQGLLGNNMFAYCGNNPVNCADPSGNAYQGIFSQINYNEHDHTYGGLRENFYALPEETFLRKAEKHIMNDDESVVLNAEDFAFYKGALVLKLPFMGKSAFSCGIIFMGSEIEDAATLRHEYGHYVHLSQIGFADYFTKAVVPSVIGFWAQVPQDKYYSLPWEYTADILGDANRTDYQYAPYVSEMSTIYWLYTVLS